MEDQIDLKSLAMILTVSIILTGGNIWIDRNTTMNWETSEQYGFSFKHPKGYVFSSSTPTDWIPGYWDGGVQGEPENGGFEVLGIFWITDKAGSEEKAIAYILEIAKVENPGLINHEIQSTTINGIDVVYCNVNLEEGEVNAPGVVCAFKDSYGRMFLPYYLSISGSHQNAFFTVEKLVKSMEIMPPTTPRVYESYWPTDGWRYASPEAMGMDSNVLQDMLNDIRADSAQVDSVMVIKDGYVVLDEYFNDYNKDTPHIIYSCTKSVVSTIFGIAHENSEIPDLDTKLLDLYPDKTPDNLNGWKESITLQDLLMMSGGFDARDSWLYEWEKLGDMHEAEDAVDYVLDLPMGFEPGSRFEYTNGVSHLLSCIITEKTGESAADYGQEHLFGPLGITLHQWDTDNMGRNWGYNRIYLTPYDMAKLGYLFLHNGEWDEDQIISAEWVAEATENRIDANLFDGYGYQWWVGNGYYTAMGYMGQFIYVFPEHDMIIVITGGTPETYDYAVQLPFRYVLPAVN